MPRPELCACNMIAWEMQWSSFLWDLRCLPESLRKLAFGGLGAATLQFGSALRHSLAYRLDLLTRMAPATTIGRQVGDLKVNAKDLGRLDLISSRSKMSQTPARSGRSHVRRKTNGWECPPAEAAWIVSCGW